MSKSIFNPTKLETVLALNDDSKKTYLASMIYALDVETLKAFLTKTHTEILQHISTQELANLCAAIVVNKEALDMLQYIFDYANKRNVLKELKDQDDKPTDIVINASQAPKEAIKNIRLLLKYEFDFNVCDAHNITTLLHPIKTEQWDIALLLLESKKYATSTLNMVASDGSHPALLLAHAQNQKKIVRALEEQGAATYYMVGEIKHYTTFNKSSLKSRAPQTPCKTYAIELYHSALNTMLNQFCMKPRIESYIGALNDLISLIPRSVDLYHKYHLMR